MKSDADSSKPNQDSYTINPSFASRPSDILFGVFDGHGRDGDKCAHYVRDNLPSLLAKAVINSRKRQTSSIDSLDSGKEMIQDAIIKSHIECNKRMHASQELDSTLSGKKVWLSRYGFLLMFMYSCLSST